MFFLLCVLFSFSTLAAMEEATCVIITDCNNESFIADMATVKLFNHLRDALDSQISKKTIKNEYCTKDNFEILFNCVNNRNALHAIDKDVIVDVYELARSVGASVEYREALALHAISLCQFIYLDKDLFHLKDVFHKNLALY